MTGYEAEVIGRRIALHLRKNHFEGCHFILDYEEKKLLDNASEPPRALAELDLTLSTVNILEANGYLYINDLAGVSVFELDKIRQLGFKRVVEISRVVSDALRSMKEPELIMGDSNDTR